MKIKIIIASVLLIAAYAPASAQWSTGSGTVYTNNSVGIGTEPSTLFDFNGGGANGNVARFRRDGNTTAGTFLTGGIVSLRGWGVNNPYIEWINNGTGGTRQGYLGWNTDRLSLALENNYNFSVEGGRSGFGLANDAGYPRAWVHAYGTRVTGPNDTNEEQVMMLSRRGVNGTGQQEVNLGMFLSKYSTATADSYSRAEFRLSYQGTAGNSWGETLLQGHTVMTLLGNGSLGVRTRLPNATVEIAGNRGNVDDRNFKLTYPNGGSLTNVELSGLAHLQTELGLGWTALYAKQGSAQYAGVFNGPVYVTGTMAIGNTTAMGAPSIGTMKLAVEGKIGAREVIVMAGTWSDYVFADDYKLPTLEYVGSFIKKNHHLPEIPSEQEVKENGVAVGEMNALLLKKIEELTLYVIDQNEKIKSLEKTVNELKSDSKR